MASRVADEGGAEPSRIPCRNLGREKHPHMGTVAGARDFQRGRRTQFPAGLDEGLGITAPIRVIKIHRQKMAIVIRQQRVHADGVVACEVVVDRLIGQWHEKPVTAVRALDARFFANARAPFVGARWRIARLARFVFPAHGIDVGASAKQAAKERDLLVCAQRHRSNRRGHGVGHTPGNAMGVQQPDQPGVFGPQPREFITCAYRHDGLTPTTGLPWSGGASTRRVSHDAPASAAARGRTLWGWT